MKKQLKPPGYWNNRKKRKIVWSYIPQKNKEKDQLDDSFYSWFWKHNPWK